MLSFEQIVDIINKIGDSELDNTSIKNRENRLSLIRVAEQLGYVVPNCGCKDKFKDLLIKIRIWIKQHPNGFPHYAMKAGVVRKGKRGTNIYNLNLTDEEAEWLLENDPEAKNYLTKIIEEENDGTELTIAESDKQEPELVESEQIAKPKKKRTSKVKK